jgi:acetyl-CoA decarbonylase/synthase complex subunit gamma
MTGLEIFKLLPRTNCQKCAYPTCLAFAMAVAAGKVTADQCPELSEDARGILLGATAPPVATVRFGRRGNELELGGETVLFRHERRFCCPTVFAVTVDASVGRDGWRTAIGEIASRRYQRIGEEVGFEAAVLTARGTEAADLGRMAEDLLTTPLAPVLAAARPSALSEAVAVLDGCARPLLWPLGGDMARWKQLASDLSCPLVVPQSLLGEVESGDVVIDVTKEAPGQIPALTAARREAVLERTKEKGWPLLVRAAGPGAAAAVCRYADIVVLDEAPTEEALALVTLRLNLYTDPQKPVMMDPGLYPVGAPGPEAPVIVTTNFSLTYYSVQPEVESSRVPCWILLTDSEGQSVLTAWAADKLNGTVVHEAIASSGVGERVTHRNLIIPGLVAMISGDVEDETGWHVRVGPREASGLPRFLRALVEKPA